MAYSELPRRPFLGHQAWSWTTLRRSNVFYYIYKRFFTLLTFKKISFERFFCIHGRKDFTELLSDRPELVLKARSVASLGSLSLFRVALPMTSLSDVTNSTATHADVSMVTSRWRKSGETRRCCGRTSAGELTWRTTTSLLQRLTAVVGRYANRSLLSVCASLWTVSRQAAVSCSGHGCSAADSKTAAPRATCIATCRTLWLMDIPPHHMCIAVGIIIVTITSHHRQPHLTSPHL